MATVVTETHPSRETATDLARLTASERQVLHMLGEGHTAKSIANTLGTTPAAVNERLREARDEVDKIVADLKGKAGALVKGARPSLSTGDIGGLQIGRAHV